MNGTDNIYYYYRKEAADLSFNVDTSQVLQQFINVFGSILPVLYFFFGGALGIFLVRGFMAILQDWIRR